MKRLAAAAVLGILVGFSAWAQGPLWTNPSVPGTETLDRLNLRLGWRTGVLVNGYRDGIATVQHLGDMIIVQNRRGAISALDPTTGAARWTTTVGLSYPIVDRVGYNDTLILVANGTRIFALDRPTGKNLWNVDLAGTPSSPPTADVDAFYVCLSNGRLSAYAYPGEPTPAPGPNGKPATRGSGAGRSAPGVPAPTQNSAGSTGSGQGLAGGGRTATVNTATNTRTATTAMQVTGGRTATTSSELNRTGRGQAVVGGPRLLWDYQTNLRISKRPVFGEKNVLVISTGREAVMLDKTTGRQSVEFTADDSFSAPLATYGEMVYAPCANGSVYAFHLPTKTVLWQVTLNGAVTEKPVATDDDLFVTTERGGLARLVRANGQLLWQNPAALQLVASNPKFVYARDEAGRLLILDHARGATLTNLDLREFSFGLANDETDRLILGADDGTIVSLHDRAYAQPLRLRNPAPPALPVAGAPATPDETKPETPAEPPAKPAPKPRTPPAAPKPAPATPGEKSTPPTPPKQ